MKEFADKYYAIGLSTTPIDKNKKPIGLWKHKQNKPTKPGNDFLNCYGIGIFCGCNNLEVIDIDCKYDLTGKLFENFKDQINPELYSKLTIQKTVNLGYHLLYRCDTIAGNKKLANREATAKEKEEGDKENVLVETRGKGGYIAVYPTPGYKFIQNHLHNIPQITTEQRQELLSIALSFNQIQPETQGENCFKEYNDKNDALSLLQKHGWTIKQERGDHVLLKRPGKTKSEWSADYLRSKKWFTVFSTSTSFETLKAYNPASIYAMLECNNDWKETARRLKAEGYGLNGKSEKSKAEIKPEELETMLQGAKIDLNKEIEKPPIILRIKQSWNLQTVEQRLFTLGNFSAITGKSKAKKTYLATGLMTALLFGSFGSLISTKIKKRVVSFDTEQSKYDAWQTAKRISKHNEYAAFMLREFSPVQRCEIINYFLSKNDNIGFVLIDGIADLATAINDEEEASRVVSLLLKWSKIYDTHICCIIHQNKSDNYATGHLGSGIMKKAEVVISVEKDKLDKRASIVRCDLIRGVSDFDDFVIRINEKGLPEMDYEEAVDYSKPIEDLF